LIILLNKIWFCKVNCGDAFCKKQSDGVFHLKNLIKYKL
jgi:hypothetical protein